MDITITTILFGISVVYIGVSILIELLQILCYYTPSKDDDAFIEKVKAKWTHAHKYLAWISVKTPAVLVMGKLLKMVGQIREDISKVEPKLVVLVEPVEVKKKKTAKKKVTKKKTVKKATRKRSVKS